MKVLFATRKYPPAIGGMELFAYELSQALAGQPDVELKLVSWGGNGRLKAVLIALPSVALRSFGALLSGGVDIIHMQDGLLAPTGWLLSRLFRKPFTVVVHGLDITYSNPIFRALVPWTVRRASAVFCISEAAAEEVRRRGVAADRIHVVPLAVEDKLRGKSDRAALDERLKLPAVASVLCTVGRLVKRKGVAWFVENVLPALVKQYPELVYLVVGEGGQRPVIEAAIEQTGLADHVQLLGRVTDDLYEAVYNGADVFVMPNITVPGDMEGFGLVLLEASLCELPVVAADTEGIRDAVQDGQNGVLVPVADAAGFQKQISRFLDNRADAKRFGQASRRFTLAHYQWPKIAESYAAVYKQMLKERR